MSPAKQRRHQRQQAEAKSLGMSMEQWRAWRTVESVERPRRDRARWKWANDLSRRERDARIAAGRATVVDGIGLYTESVMDHLRAAMTRHILYGAAS